MSRAIERLEAKITALVAISADDIVRREGTSRARRRAIEEILADAGMSHSEIGRVLGKSKQAVSQAIAKSKRSATVESRNGEKDGE